MYMAKEPYVYGQRALCVWQKSPVCMAKEAYVYGKRALCMAKEAYVYGKRGLIALAYLLIRHEGPQCDGKRALCIWQKSPMYMAKEA